MVATGDSVAESSQPTSTDTVVPSVPPSTDAAVDSAAADTNSSPPGGVAADSNPIRDNDKVPAPAITSPAAGGSDRPLNPVPNPQPDRSPPVIADSSRTRGSSLKRKWGQDMQEATSSDSESAAAPAKAPRLGKQNNALFLSDSGSEGSLESTSENGPEYEVDAIIRWRDNVCLLFICISAHH
jgi:hypothetical protein